MTREQKKQMKSYLRPQQVFYGNGDDDYVLRPSMAMTIHAKIGNDSNLDKIEELVIDVYMWCIEKDKNYIPSLFIREVKKRYFRWWYREQGLTARGTIPVGGKRLHIQNDYDDDGINMIYNIADPDSFKEILEEGEQDD